MFRSNLKVFACVLVAIASITLWYEDANAQRGRRRFRHSPAESHQPKREVSASMNSAESMHKALRIPGDAKQFDRFRVIPSAYEPYDPYVSIPSSRDFSKSEQALDAKDYSELSAAWKVVAVELNRIRLGLESRDSGSSNKETKEASANTPSEMSIYAETLIGLDSNRMRELQTNLSARAHCEDLLELLKSLNVEPPSSSPGSSPDAPEEIPEEELDAKLQAILLWWLRLTELLSNWDSLFASESSCIRSNQLALRFLDTVLRHKSIPLHNSRDSVDLSFFSEDFHVAVRIYRIVDGITSKCLTEEDFDPAAVRTAEKELLELGCGREDLSKLWIWCAKASMWLGKPRNVRNILELQSNEEQLREGKAEYKAILEETSILFATNRSVAKASSLPFESTFEQTMIQLSQERAALLAKFLTRARVLVPSEIPLIARKLQSCADENDQRLLSILRSLVTTQSDTSDSVSQESNKGSEVNADEAGSTPATKPFDIDDIINDEIKETNKNVK